MGKYIFKKWKDCDICGRPYPIHELRTQNGRAKCPTCWDAPADQRR